MRFAGRFQGINHLNWVPLRICRSEKRGGNTAAGTSELVASSSACLMPEESAAALQMRFNWGLFCRAELGALVLLPQSIPVGLLSGAQPRVALCLHRIQAECQPMSRHCFLSKRDRERKNS